MTQHTLLIQSIDFLNRNTRRLYAITFVELKPNMSVPKPIAVKREEKQVDQKKPDKIDKDFVELMRLAKLRMKTSRFLTEGD